MYKLSNLLLIEDSLEESTMLSEEDYKVIQNLCLEQLKIIESKDATYVYLYDNKVLLMLLHCSKLKDAELDIEADDNEFVAIISIATEEDKKMNSNMFILFNKAHNKDFKNVERGL